MRESILWMKRLAALALFATLAVAVALLSGQIMGASPSTSIAPITVDRAGPDRTQTERARTARKKSDDAKQRQGGGKTSSGGSETVTPTPLPAGDDDDADDTDDADDAEPDTDDGVDDD